MKIELNRKKVVSINIQMYVSRHWPHKTVITLLCEIYNLKQMKNPNLGIHKNKNINKFLTLARKEKNISPPKQQEPHRPGPEGATCRPR